MKQVVNGKIYDTETATLIAEYDNGLGRSDFRCLSENLYITKKGAFFISGEGGAMSRWSESNGNTSCGGIGILPLSKEEALEWCESYAGAEVIEQYFSDVIEEA